MSEPDRDDDRRAPDISLTLVESIVQEALDADPADRMRIVNERCAEDAALRGEVLRLVDLPDDALQGFLDGTAAVLAHGDESAKNRLIPLRIGRYEINRSVGEGGMGVVYEAQQANPRRRVALKLIRAGFPSEGEQRRFRREAEVLGQLHHAGIAHIYEAGYADVVGPAGTLASQPFIAMEFIEGAPITEYVGGRSLDDRTALELFLAVCEAVEHAHLKGIVHRDLKPGNIIVEESGQPKILDFGIARLVGPGHEETTLRTDAGQLIGTLPYMSPEQVEGDSSLIDTRTDVYALGVILYELLTGRLPHDVRHRSLHDGIRIIREDEPTRLSSINSRFRGDLDTIAAKALEKSKERRYASAAALADDIRRYLKDEPIVARPASTFYQLQKFARRNRALVGGVSATILALIAGLVGMVFFASREHSQRIRADKKTLEARRLAYRASLSAASGALANGEIVAAKENLANAPEDLRGWEWAYYDHAAHRPLRQFSVPTESQFCFGAASADLGRLALQYVHGEIAVIDTNDGRRMLIMNGPAGSLRRGMSLSPNGRLLAATTSDGVSAIYDVDNGRRLYTLEDVCSLGDFSSDSSFLLVLQKSSPILKVVGAARGTVQRSIQVPLKEMNDARLSPDGKLFVVSLGGTNHVGELESGRILHAQIGWDWSFSGDSRTFQLFGEAGKIVDSRTGGVLPPGNLESKYSMKCWRPDSKLLATFDSSDGFLFREATTHTRMCRLPTASEPFLGTFSSDSRRFLTVVKDGAVTLWDAEMTDSPMRIGLVGRDKCFGSAISWDGNYVASAEWGMVSLVESRTSRLRWRRPVCRDYLECVAFNRSGDTIAAASRRGRVYQLSSESGEVIRRCDVKDPAIRSLVFLPVRNTFVAVCDSSAVFEIGKSRKADGEAHNDIGRLLTAQVAERATVLDAAVNHAGNQFAVAIKTGLESESQSSESASHSEILLIDGRDYSLTRRIHAGEAAVQSLCFSPDDSKIAAGCRDYCVRVFDVSSGRQEGACPGATSEITALVISPDGSRLVGGGSDGSLTFWDAITKERLTAVTAATGPLYAVGFSSAGESLVAAGIEQPLILLETRDPGSDGAARASYLRGRAVADAMVTDGVLAGEMVERLLQDSALDSDTRDAATAYARARGDNPNLLNSWAWATALRGSASGEEYDRGLVLAQAAAQSFPDEYGIQNTIGVLQYRAGRFEDAIRTLSACVEIGRRAQGMTHPCDLIFLAMARRKHGEADARGVLEEAESSMMNPRFASDNELLGFLQEARSLFGEGSAPNR